MMSLPVWSHVLSGGSGRGGVGGGMALPPPVNKHV